VTLSFFDPLVSSEAFSSTTMSTPFVRPIQAELSTLKPPPPIVYTIAGSDSGGGAGIQADLHAIHAMGCHGCSAITCLTAQNSVGVTSVHTPPPSFLQAQLDALASDLPPKAIKIGMIGSPEVAKTVASFLSQVRPSPNSLPWVVLDPVMISTSGHALICEETKQTLISKVFPLCDLLTPNKFEAEALLNRTLSTPKEVEEGAREIIEKFNVKAVLIKGGHSLAEGSDSSNLAFDSGDLNATLGFAQDYLLTRKSDDNGDAKERRLCDGEHGVWLRSRRYDSMHTHGTGCTLSSCIASALALGELGGSGAMKAMQVADAGCLAKAYVTAGIAKSQGLGQGPGPVAHTHFPSTSAHYPSIVLDPTLVSSHGEFLHMTEWSNDSDSSLRLGRILPIVDTVEWVKRLCNTPGVTDIQLRIKGQTDPKDSVKQAQIACQAKNVRLWINDYWREAMAHGCFGVHLGQEDLTKCALEGGLQLMQAKGMALGVSTHSFAELAVALGVKPSYISLGPVFATSSKKVAFEPQGLDTVQKWRQLVPRDIPLVVIGGINDASSVIAVRERGADCVAVIGAITGAEDIAQAVANLNQAMTAKQI